MVYDLTVKRNELYEFFYFRWLERKLKTSESLGLDSCNACGYCCYYSVCIPTPEELEVIAKAMNLDPIDFMLKYCAFAHFHEETKTKTVCILYPRFLTKSIIHKAGQQLYYMDFFDTKGCIFLIENNKCYLHPIRPQEARLMICWQSHKHNEPIRSWDNDILTTQFGVNIERDTDNP